MAITFQFPIVGGQVITAAMLNELIYSIQDGSIFTSVSFVSDLITTLDGRVSNLENTVSTLAAGTARNFIREQFTLTTGQSSVPLSHVPVLDSEIVILNGSSLAKDNIPVGVGGDYSVSGSTLSFVGELSLQLLAGDRLVVVYSYEVL